MRKFLTLGLVLFSMLSYSQTSTKPANILNGTPIEEDVDFLYSSEEVPTGLWRKIKKSSLTFTSNQIVDLPTTIETVSDTIYYPLISNPANYVKGDGTASEYIKGDGTKGTLPTIPPAQVDADWNSVTSPSKILNKPTIPAAQVNSDWDSVSGVQQILNKPTIPAAQIASDYTQTNSAALDYIKNKPYEHTVATAGGAGNAVFYITSDKTSTGTALYTTIDYVNPIINDSTINYSYGWSYNAGTKALTVNCKSAVGINIALLGLTLLGTPANVANGINVFVYVKGH